MERYKLRKSSWRTHWKTKILMAGVSAVDSETVVPVSNIYKLPQPWRHTMCEVACDLCENECKSIIVYRVPFRHLLEIWCCDKCNTRVGSEELHSYVFNCNWNEIPLNESFLGIDQCKEITVRLSSGEIESGWQIKSHKSSKNCPPVIYDLKDRTIFVYAFLGSRRKYIPLKSICSLNPHWNDVRLDLSHCTVLLDTYKKLWHFRFIRSKYFARTQLILMLKLPEELVRELSHY
jgi:hypothetical protein